MLDLDSAAREIGAGRRGPNARFDGVTTDSRQVARADLFVALRGERFDGHAFADQALAAGAAAAMVDDPDRVATHGASLLLVDDTLQGLGRLARAWRARFSPALVGVTGSNGKTTVKEMIAGILRADAGDEAVLATSGNLNNAIGVPLMLLRLRSHHRYAVIEMGMNHLGEIRYLTGLASPTVALVTNAGTAHIGELGSREAIAQAKGELYEGLRDAIAVINADDRFASYWRGLNSSRQVVDFGFDQPAAVRGSLTGAVLSVRTPAAAYELRLRVPGLHNAHNALAACAVAHSLAMPPAAVVRGLQEYEGTRGRLQHRAGMGGSLIIDDTYNANPDSTQAAVAVLAAQPGARILVLGDMGELGPEGPALHAQVGAQARGAGIERLFALGPLSSEAARAFGAGARHFDDVDALASEL
ncbi:MAG TPA: UDP-N-acetylmuramoyl-tripeptide--D-alanyl-D-alanine ligase, partial [Burkholderiales bacterium]|nr:UDP-N-acetylmuramoyl-tripeptide--D-alanyl-D-alanine ligase [Burkholderiales bacterium]